MEIEELRKSIDEIDKEIVKLIAKRFEVVKRIAEEKIAKNKGVLDEERETLVKMNWRRYALEYGVPINVVEELIELLIKYSKSYQLSLMATSRKYKRNITFIGYGNMTRVLVKQLVQVGHDVVISGRSIDKAKRLADELRCKCMDVSQAIEHGEFIVLALSLDAFIDKYVDSISLYFKDKIVMDILSSKGWVFNYLENKSIKENFKYVSLHPLFGPLTPPVSEKIAVIPSKTGVDVLQDVIDLWISAGLEPVVVDFEEHEKAMAIVQVLTHLYLIAFSRASNELIKELNINPDRLSTPTYRDIKAVTERIKYIENVVFEIQRNNPFSNLVRKKALEVLNNIIESIGR